MEDLRERTVRNLYYQGVLTVSTAVAGALSVLVLARVLSPADLGRAVLALLVVQSAEMVADFGILSAVLARREEVATAIPVGATLRIVLSLGATAVLVGATFFLSGPLGAVGIQDLLLPLAVVPFVSGLGFASQATLRLELDFRKLTLAQAGGTIGSPVAQATLALLGFGVWSIVWGAIFGHLLAFTLLQVVRPVFWRPTIERAAWRALLGFGSRVVSAAFLTDVFYLASAAAVFLLAGATALGAFLLAMRLGSLVPQRSLAIVIEVLLPTISKIRQEGGDVRSGYLEGVRAVMLPTAFANFAGLALAAPGVLVIGGLRWEVAVVGVQVLALGGIVTVLAGIATPYLLTMGRPGVALAMNALSVALLALVGIPLLSAFGMLAFLFALLVIASASFVGTSLFVRAIGGPGPVEVLRAAGPALATGAAAAGAGLGVVLVVADPFPALVAGSAVYIAAALAADRLAFAGANFARVRHFARIAITPATKSP